MSELLTEVTNVITPDLLIKLVKVVAGFLVLLVLYVILKKIIRKICAKKTKIKPHTSSIILKFLKYTFFVLVTVYILGIFGVKLTALFGAAGIAGVAIGFAAQTSFSNIISGVFLLTEHAFKIGDYIVMGETAGVIDSIDMLSIRIHTLDNQMIRIPNETIIKSNLQNNSYFDTRRITVDVDVSYDTDIKKALEVLATVPKYCPLVLKDPEPMAFCKSFDDSGIMLTLAVWLQKDDFIEVKNSVFIGIQKVMNDNEIEIPFNQIVVHESNVK